MSQEVVQGAEFRLVRDEDQGLYLLQAGADGAFRTFAVTKTGKLDQLREAARAKAEEQQQQPSNG